MATATTQSASGRAGSAWLDPAVSEVRLPNPVIGSDGPIYSCPGCEHGLRVFGRGRHRVYFELADGRSEDPVMNGRCPACGQGLPGKNPTGARS